MYSLVGIDGNAFSIIAYVKRAMKQERISKEAIEQYIKEAMLSDYDHLLMVSIDKIDELNRKYEQYE